MYSKYYLLIGNIQDISENCNWGDYYSKLNPRSGLCYGMSHMWGQALLANDTKTFYRRLEILTTNYSYKNKRLSEIINDHTKLQKKMPPDSKPEAQYYYHKEKK